MTINFAPIAEAPLAIQIHLATILPTIAIGTAQIFLPKGTRLHRITGYVFLGLLLATAFAGFFIRTLNPPGFSLPHYTSIGVVAASIATVISARLKNSYIHKMCTYSLYATVLVTGLTAFLGHRVLHRVFFGG